MNKTKRKILDAALKLFNEQGIANVSQHTIAKHLGISPGNLTYHYPKKAAIEEALYFELVGLMDDAFDLFSSQKTAVQSLIKSSETLFEHMYHYRFFFFDIVHIFRTNNIIKEHYTQLQANRKVQFKEIIQQLSTKGILRQEELPNEYEKLYERIQLTFDFYLAYSGITRNKINKELINEQSTSFIYTLYPYLTDKGKLTAIF
ncbi:MAG: TetR/AcrR family transcriptional regulator [Flavobacteriales bacterium]|jgi:AcrR family transcriptional regulator|nr:TetR/AcrR family transcriptional regulator [Flavobacteriales bacterium]